MNISETKRNLLYIAISVLISSSVSIFIFNQISTPEESQDFSQAAATSTQESFVKKLEVQKQNVQPASTGAGDQFEEVLKTLKQQYAELDKKLQTLELQQGQEYESGAADESLQLSPEEEDQLAQQRRSENLALMESTLYTEAVDENWSMSSEMTVMDSLAVASEQLTVESVECASTICALHLAANGVASGSDVMQGFSRNINWPGEMTMQYDTTARRGIAYLAREGHSLPVAQQ